MRQRILVSLLCILILFNLKTFCQKIEYVDSSEVYLLSLFKFENDVENFYKKDWLNLNNQNTLQVLLLKATQNIQFHLITGDNKYNFVPINDSLKINYIDTIIKKYAIANMYFLTNWKYNPISTIDSTLYFENTDTSIIIKYLMYRNNPLMKKYIKNVYMSPFFDNGDILEGRLINDFKSNEVGYSNILQAEVHNTVDQCLFSDNGTYYMLLKVSLTYVIIDDINMDYLYCNKNPLNGLHSQFDDYFYIDNKIPVRIKYFEKNNKKPIAIPLYIKLLKPYNDKYRFYLDRIIE